MAIIDELDIGIIAALIGVMTSLAFTWAKEKHAKTKEINKIRTLLNEDFSKLYKEITKDLKLFQNELDGLGTKGDLVNKLFSGEIDWSKIYSEYGIFYDLEYWQAIVSSGSLLKLDKDEIRHVQAVYNSMDWYNTELREMHEEMTDQLYKDLNPEDTNAQYDEEPDKEGIRELLKGYFEDVIEMMNGCIDDLKELEKFSLLKIY